jgi:ribosome-binding protein aMBF1 (putative translation factor)
MARPKNADSFIDGATAREILLEDPAARAEYERLEARERLINRVIGARLARGWSQADLARELGVRRPVISRFESGTVDPRWSTIVKVFGALGLSLTASDGTSEDRLAG